MGHVHETAIAADAAAQSRQRDSDVGFRHWLWEKAPRARCRSQATHIRPRVPDSMGGSSEGGDSSPSPLPLLVSGGPLTCKSSSGHGDGSLSLRLEGAGGRPSL